jgi:integrase
VRTGEAIGARWSEFDINAGQWIIPGSRMKTGVEHRVPLAPRAFEILRELQARRVSEFVFANASTGRPLSNMSMLKLLAIMGCSNVTVHGFRSSFRDWVSEQTEFQHEVAEAALAHTVGSKVVAAYRRLDLFEKQRKLMEAWAAYCGGVS